MPLLDILSSSHGVGPVCHKLNIAPVDILPAL